MRGTSRRFGIVLSVGLSLASVAVGTIATAWADESSPTPKLKPLLQQPGSHESRVQAEAEGNGSVSRGQPPAAVAGFLAAHCADCHGDGGEEGGFAIESLGWPDDGLAFSSDGHARWVRVLDRIATGEMPPADSDQPSESERADLEGRLRPALVAADEHRHRTEGRGRVRRLNRSEYETALSDLLMTPLRIADQLPEDARAHGFDTVGEALNLSSVQMAAYLDAVDAALEAATHLAPPPVSERFRLRLDQNGNFMQTYRRGGPFRVEPDGVVLMARELFSHYNGVVPQWTAARDGRYRVVVRAALVDSDEPVVLTVRAGGTGHSESLHVPSRVMDHYVVGPDTSDSPRDFVWEGDLLRGHFLHLSPESLRPMRFGNDIEKKLAFRGPGVKVHHIDVEGPLPRPVADPYAGDAVADATGAADGYVTASWPPASHRLLWGGIATEPLPDDELPRSLPGKLDPNSHLREPPSKVAEPKTARVKKDKESGNRFAYKGPITVAGVTVGGEPIYRAAARLDDPAPRTRRLVTQTPHADAERLLRRFVPLAFRMPESTADDAIAERAAPYVALAHRWLDDGATFEEAMRTGYQAILCSPEFLYRRDSLPTASESDGSLSAAALAERLAFFLWNGPPDATLVGAALTDPAVRGDAADAMLDDPRSERFLTHLLDEWLDLRLIDFTAPDSTLYPEHDNLLQWSMLEETRGTIREMLDADRPVAELIDSDWAMLNWRLARHYGLEREAAAAGVNEPDGMRVRRVRLPKGSVRGGLLTQASVLKVTANGTTTSPVIRGVWILDRILGDPPSPPPPGVPAIEPDIRGAVTVREQIEKHRESESCASCHAAIDPPGLALESFDVIGGHRDRYRAINPNLANVRLKFGPEPRPLKWQDGLPVDASGQTEDGRAFAGIQEYKRLLLADRRQIARSVVEKLLVYATGAAPSIADRDEVEAILDAAAPRYGMRTLLRETVASETFAKK